MSDSHQADGNPLDYQGGSATHSEQSEFPQDIFAKVARTAYRFLNPVARYLCYGAAVVTLLMSLFMVVDLVSRMIFNYPLSGMIELQTFMLIVMAFFQYHLYDVEKPTCIR